MSSLFLLGCTSVGDLITSTSARRKSLQSEAWWERTVPCRGVCVCYCLFVCLSLLNQASKGQRSIFVRFFPKTSTVLILRVLSATHGTNISCYVHHTYPAALQYYTVAEFTSVSTLMSSSSV